MKKQASTKKVIITVAIIIAIAILIGWGYQYSKNITPDPPGTVTLSQGTQARFETLSIGLSSVDSNSAQVSIHQDGEAGSESRQVVAGDTVDISGYIIEITSVNEGFNFSFKPGSSHGNVKLIIKRQ